MDIIIWSSIVIGITEVIKRASGMNTRFVPLLTLLITFGILGIFALISGVTPTWEAIQDGFIVSLSAVGLFSGIKSTIK